jgi:hypothetical protein
MRTLAAALVFLVPQVWAQNTPSNGLVGYWKLNGDAADSSGAQNPGNLIYRYAPYPAFQAGRLGLAFNSGGGAYVQVPDAPSLSALTSVTVEAWVYLNNYPATPPWGVSGGAPIVHKWGPAGASDDEFRLIVWHTKKLCGTVSGSRGYFNLESTIDFPLRTWTHVALTLDTARGVATLFIDGQANASLATNVIGDRDTYMPVEIGYVWHDSGGPISFDGVIDEVRIWNQALSQADIQVNMNRELPPLGPAKLWIGLKNSDDQGTQFDLRVELYKNLTTLLSAGEALCVTGVTRNPSLAKQVEVAFGQVAEDSLNSGDQLSLRILTRVGTNVDGTKCSGPGGSHNSAVGLRLYYDAMSRPSRFGAETPPDPLSGFFLHSSSTDFFDTAAPTASTPKYKDSSAVSFVDGNPWKAIGTWSMTVP